MHDWLLAVILGIVEGITEFLPVSSTGHLLLTENVLQKLHMLTSQPSDLFNVVIQCGAVVAVIPLFRARFDQFIHRWNERATQDYLMKLMTAFVITGVIGLAIEKHLKLKDDAVPIAIALFTGGVLFLAAEFYLRGKKVTNEITWAVAIAVGFGQLIAVIFPGSSRSGSTIILSLFLGLARPAATEFSFLVGIPTMLAAGGYKIFKALHHPPLDAPPENWGFIILTTLIAAVVSFIAVKWLLRYVQSHTFNAFGWYRIAIGIVVFLLMR